MPRRLALLAPVVLALCLLTGCRGTHDVRSALRVAPQASVQQMIEEGRVRAEVRSVVPSRQRLVPETLLGARPRSLHGVPAYGIARLAPIEALTHRPLDGPVDLGLPIVVDLGAGEAPFDDGVAPFHPGDPVRGGFSDSVLSLMLRQPTGGRTHVFGLAAVSRDQDLTVLESLPEADFSFVVVGFGASF